MGTWSRFWRQLCRKSRDIWAAIRIHRSTTGNHQMTILGTQLLLPGNSLKIIVEMINEMISLINTMPLYENACCNFFAYFMHILLSLSSRTLGFNNIRYSAYSFPPNFIHKYFLISFKLCQMPIIVGIFPRFHSFLFFWENLRIFLWIYQIIEHCHNLTNNSFLQLPK